MTQAERVLAFLRANPGASRMEIATGLHPWVANPTARISDLRAAGHDVQLVKRPDGHTGWRVVEQRVDRVLEAPALFGEVA